MNDNPIDQTAQPTPDEHDDAAPAASPTVEEVEEQIREAESLHQELTQRLKATAGQ